MDSEPVQEMFRRAALRHWDCLAVEHGERQVTYGQLEEQSTRLASFLRNHRIEAGSRVAILCQYRDCLIAAILACLKGGFVFVPLDPAAPPARLATVVQEVEPACWVVEAGLLDRVGGLTSEIRVVVVDGKGGEAEPLGFQELAGWPSYTAGELPVGPVDLDAMCSIYFTSGSTGRPKAIAGRLKAIGHFIRWELELLGVGEGVRVSQLTSPAFDASLRDVFLPLCAGGVACAPASRETVLDPGALLAWLETTRVEVMHCVPSLFRGLLGEGLCRERLAALRWVLLAGERLLPEDVRRWVEVFGDRVGLVNLYGATETTMTKLFYRVSSADGRRSSIPIGKPMPGVRAVVLDERSGVCPLGVVGEIYVRTPYRSLGYFNRPDLTQEAFVPNPLTGDPDDLVYRTGDFGRLLEDGNLELVGRRDHQVKIRGARVELGEVENVLRRHAEVRDLAVVDRVIAEGEVQLIAYVVLDREVAAGELRRFCAEQMPDYMVPSVFAQLAAIPRTANGKLDRPALPLPADARAARGDGGRAPRGPVEELLAEIWITLLGLPQIGVDEDFFELGGHSLLAVRLLSRLRASFGLELTLRALFDGPTIAQLARAIEAANPQEGMPPPLVPVARDGPLPLSWAQERLWFLQELAPASTAYTMFRGIRLRGRLSIELLERAFGEVVLRHESLRTTFHELAGQPIQLVGGLPPLALLVVDLSGLSTGSRAVEEGLRAAELSELAFDLRRGPLLRVVALRLDLEDHTLLLTMHHIVSDGWSMTVLANEVVTLYAALAEGATGRLPELPIQYADWAVWQRQWLRGEVLEAQVAYWRRHLAGAPELIELSTDRPRPAVQSFRGSVRTFTLPASLSHDLRQLARRESATLFVTLLAAFAVLLQDQTGQGDIVVGTSVANRDRLEVENLIGFLANQLALRFDLAGSPRFLDLLSRVRRIVIDGYAHRHVAFQQVVEAVHPRRDLSRNPLFQVMFEMEHRSQEGESEGEIGSDRTRARVDLTLYLLDRGGSLDGRLEYSSDLFDSATAELLAARYERLLASIVARPEQHTDSFDLLSEVEKGELMMKEELRAKSTLGRFKSIAPKAVPLAEGRLVEVSTLSPDQPLPLVLRPAVSDFDLADWAKDNLELIQSRLDQHGAILFRGFGVDSIPEFEGLTSAICSDLYTENAEHERIQGNVSTPVFYPPEKKLLWHNENSFNYSWPTKLFFCCAQAAAQGGETPLVDSRRVLQAISPKVQDLFRDKGVQYLRNYGTGLGLGWQRVFRSDSRAEVERFCRLDSFDFEWLEGDRLRTRCTRPAVIQHPRTGEWSWFSQLPHWHPFFLDGATRASLEEIFQQPEDMPRNCFFGDGTAIGDEIAAEIMNAYQSLEIAFPWQRGDVLLVDNILTAHARNPFVGERKLLIAMGEMRRFE